MVNKSLSVDEQHYYKNNFEDLYFSMCCMAFSFLALLQQLLINKQMWPKNAELPQGKSLKMPFKASSNCTINISSVFFLVLLDQCLKLLPFLFTD